MAPKKKTQNSAVGHSLIRHRFNRSKAPEHSDSRILDSVDPSAHQSSLQSVVERNDLDELLAMADLAGRDFAAEKENVVIFDSGSRPPESTAVTMAARAAATESLNRNHLAVPRRPKWHAGMGADELDRREQAVFLEWRRRLAALEEDEALVLTPFEKNLQTWRQLWRVVERSDLVVTVVDGRNPLLYRCEDLEHYVREVNHRKRALLLLNKADLLPLEVRLAWARFFVSNGVPFLFWSAKQATGSLDGKAADSDGPDHPVVRPPAPGFRPDAAENGHVGQDIMEAVRILGRDELLDRLEAAAVAAVIAPGVEAIIAPGVEAGRAPGGEPPVAEPCQGVSSGLGSEGPIHGSQGSGQGPEGTGSGEDRLDYGGEAKKDGLGADKTKSSGEDGLDDGGKPEGGGLGHGGEELGHVDAKPGGTELISSETEEVGSVPGRLVSQGIIPSAVGGHGEARPRSGITGSSEAGPSGMAADGSMRVTVGFVGYPNVGKSSTINALVGAKKTGVTSTPGKTKHFQTLLVAGRPHLLLCDCPGLVFPSLGYSKAEMVAAGVLPIDRLTDHRGPVGWVAAQVPRAEIERSLGVVIPLPAVHESPDRPPTASEVLRAFCRARGYIGPGGLPDETRASRMILKEYVDGRLLHCHFPPGQEVGQASSSESKPGLVLGGETDHGPEESTSAADVTAASGTEFNRAAGGELANDVVRESTRGSGAGIDGARSQNVARFDDDPDFMEVVDPSAGGERGGLKGASRPEYKMKKKGARVKDRSWRAARTDDGDADGMPISRVIMKPASHGATAQAVALL